MPTAQSSSEQVQSMQRFYRWQASVYDATRWAFLFGRRTLYGQLPQEEHQTLLEVGCGTGWNLKNLAALHPTWQLTGIDVSPDMLAQARKATSKFRGRVKLVQEPYGVSATRKPVDIVLFSYSLTMFNPGWEAAIEQAWSDLKPGGHIAVVDFHDAPQPWFRSWMKYNRVRMDRHLLPFLERRFQTQLNIVRSTHVLLWRYFIFVGKKG